MAKTILTVCLLLCITCAANAQHITGNAPVNPFIGINFNNSYKDTVTINATYTGEHGNPGDKNTITLQQIQKLYGVNLSRFKKAIGFSFNGYPNNFYAPYSKNNEQAISAIKPNTLVQLKCTVYKFFTIDGISNFFYVDKIL